VPLAITAPATLAVTFAPVPPGPGPQRTPPWVGKPIPAPATVGQTNSVPGGGSSGSVSTGGGGFPLWLAVVLLAVLAAAVVAGERVVRRRRAHAGQAGAPTDGRVGDVPVPIDVARPVSPPAPTSVLASEPLPLGAPGDLVVRVLGPVEVTGWREEPDRAVVAELCYYLALHSSRGVRGDDVLAALWPLDGNRGDATKDSVRSYLSLVRRAVGEDRLPKLGRSRTYRLSGFVTDWHRFVELSKVAKGLDGAEADGIRSQALSLVRGAPFAETPGGQYEWAFDEYLASGMVTAIVDCAHRLSAGRLAAGDPEGAEQAARRGLEISRFELVLFEDLARAKDGQGDPDGLRRVLADAARVLDEAGMAELGARLSNKTVHDRHPV